MPRQARLDAPGALHHVMGRGIERTNIFRTDRDRDDFLNRLADLCLDGNLIVYAWALLPNHFHLLARTGRQPISKSMRRLLTWCRGSAIPWSDDFVGESSCRLAGSNRVDKISQVVLEPTSPFSFAFSLKIISYF